MIQQSRKETLRRRWADLSSSIEGIRPNVSVDNLSRKPKLSRLSKETLAARIQEYRAFVDPDFDPDSDACFNKSSLDRWAAGKSLPQPWHREALVLTLKFLGWHISSGNELLVAGLADPDIADERWAQALAWSKPNLHLEWSTMHKRWVTGQKIPMARASRSLSPQLWDKDRMIAGIQAATGCHHPSILYALSQLEVGDLDRALDHARGLL